MSARRWRSVAVIPDQVTEAATVTLFATEFPRALAGEEWLAIPMLGRGIEVAVPEANFESARASLLALGQMTNCASGAVYSDREEVISVGHAESGDVTARAPSMFDPTPSLDALVGAELPALLCTATGLAVRRLAGHDAFLAVARGEVEESVRHLVASFENHARSVDVLAAAVAWLERVVARRTGLVASESPLLEPVIVAGARAAHIHVVQLCGAEPSVDRLTDEIGVFRRITPMR